MNPKKCALLQRQVSFLGHIVRGEGISTDPSKIEAVKTGLFLQMSKRSEAS